ncbi:hypothetical protein ABPG73_006425 [Tetrahymena malaccensis]
MSEQNQNIAQTFYVDQIYSFSAESYVINSYQHFDLPEYDIYIEEIKTYTDFLEINPTRSGLETYIGNLPIIQLYRRDQIQICKALEAQGYKLDGIINGGGFSLLISASTNQQKNLVIKMVQNKDNSNEAVNKEKEIYKLLKEGKKQNHFIELIDHIRVLDNWDAFIYKKYKSSLLQEYNDYQQGKKTFTEQSMLTFVFDLIHGLIEFRRASIIHLDIKIANILINDDGNLVYCDFGISEIKKENQIINCKGFTNNFSPREQVNQDQNKNIDFESDIYSLGKTLQILIDLFKEHNPESQLVEFADGLLKIVNNQMIQEDIKLRSNCYQVQSQVYQLFKKIPQTFVCNHQKYFEGLKYEIKQYLELNPDYFIEKLNYSQKIFFNQNNNNLDINQLKRCEYLQTQISKSFLDQKDFFIKNELSKFEKSSSYYLNDFYESVLKSKRKENLFAYTKYSIQEKKDQKIDLCGMIVKIQQYLSCLQVDEIIKFFDDFKIYYREKLTSDLLNFTLENLIKVIDEYRIHTLRSIEEFEYFLIDYDNIEIIYYDLKKLKYEQTTDNISYLLKYISTDNIQQFYNSLMFILSRNVIKLNYRNALCFTKDSKNKIEQFFKEINELKINALQKPSFKEIELKFQEALEKYQDFDFRNNNISDDNVLEDLDFNINENESIESVLINLTGNQIKGKCVNKLCKFIEKTSNLEEISIYLTQNLIQKLCSDLLIESIQKCKKLIRLKLDVSLNPLKYSKSGFNLQQLSVHPQLKEIDLNFKKTFIGKNYQNNEIVEGKISCLERITFSFENNQMDLAALNNLAESISQFKTAIYLDLDLQQNQINLDSFKVLSSKICLLSNLRHLRLSLQENQIDSNSMKCLSQELVQLKHLNLLYLNLVNNDIQSGDILQLIESLSMLSNFQYLSLAFWLNQNDIVQILQFGNVLKKCLKINSIQLCVQTHNLTKNHVRNLINKIRKNLRLTSFNYIL